MLVKDNVYCILGSRMLEEALQPHWDPRGQAAPWRAAWKWAPQRKGGNDSLSTPLGESPTYRTWLLICHRKWMLNLAGSEEDITVSKKRINLLETLWGKAYSFRVTLRHFIACFCAASWLPTDNQPSKHT